MDVATVIHNGVLNSARELLTDPEALAVGIEVLTNADGSPEEKLATVIEAMVASRKVEVEQLEFERDLESYTRPQLYRMAGACGAYVTSAYRKEDLITALRAEQRKRREMS